MQRLAGDIVVVPSATYGFLHRRWTGLSFLCGGDGGLNVRLIPLDVLTDVLNAAPVEKSNKAPTGRDCYLLYFLLAFVGCFPVLLAPCSHVRGVGCGGVGITEELGNILVDLGRLCQSLVHMRKLEHSPRRRWA